MKFRTWLASALLAAGSVALVPLAAAQQQPDEPGVRGGDFGTQSGTAQAEARPQAPPAEAQGASPQQPREGEFAAAEEAPAGDAAQRPPAQGGVGGGPITR